MNSTPHGLRHRRLWGVVAGVVAVTTGVLLHLPDVNRAVEHARMGMPGMAGMSMWTPSMAAGMALLVGGVGIAALSLLWRMPPPSGDRLPVDAIEHGRLGPRYWLTCLALTVALVIDIMKPLTLGFVVPGMSREYGLPLDTVAVLPMVALTGTVLGSVVWGLLGDRYGRRPAFVLATVVFVATSACGAMPTFGWNLVMCFVMGTSAGGLLPLAFTLIAELAPRRHRGWLAVAVGGAGGIGGYLAASTAAYQLEPVFGWRALWLVGLPTGLLLLALMPLIPESPLFLLRHGRRKAAEQILHRYGAHLGAPVAAPAGQPATARVGVGTLLRRYPVLTAVVGTVGTAWGLVNFGFLVMLPAQLRESGMASAAVTGLLARSALYSAPALILVVLLYAAWSGRRSLALFVAATGLALVGVAAWASWGAVPELLVVSVGTLVLALSAVNAILLPYSAELYPTALRATGSGFVAATTKAGGLLGPFAILATLRVGSGTSPLVVSATAMAALSLLAAGLMLRYGTEPPPNVDPEPARFAGAGVSAGG
ncbi:MAG: MFS transporter [Micromonosporaceae bacterium]